MSAIAKPIPDRMFGNFFHSGIFFDPDTEYKKFIKDSENYECRPASLRNETLTAGEGACCYSDFIYVKRIECAYKWSGGDGEDGMAVFLWPLQGNQIQTLIFETGTEPKDWTNTYLDVSPGLYTVIFQAYQHGTTPIYGYIDNLEILPALHLTPCNPGREIFPMPTGSLTLSGHAPAWWGSIPIPTGNLTLSGHMPAFGTPIIPIPTGNLHLINRNPSYIWRMPASFYPVAQTIYTCTLTGDTDIDLPISSFLARMRNGKPSYVQCVIPNSGDYEAEIFARLDGQIIIRKGYILADGTRNTEKISQVDFESLSIDQGGRSGSATIVGHKTIPATSPKTWAIKNLSYYAFQANGKRRARAEVDLFLRTGDTVFYMRNGVEESFIVGEIIYVVNPRMAYMEVVEA